MTSIEAASIKISIIGGDKRQSYMAELFCQLGYSVSILGIPPVSAHDRLHICSRLEEAVTGSRMILCPIPFQKNLGVTFDELKRVMVPGQTLAGGYLPGEVLDACRELGVISYDMMKQESMIIFNTIATAEGAIAECLIHHPGNLHGEKALVLGYGRCGKTLADKLKGLSARVTVCARSKEELSTASALGTDVLELAKLHFEIHSFPYIFNTIPAMVLDTHAIHRVRQDAILIDIASAPGGVDYEAAKAAGINARLCPGLPGIYAPLASAKALVTDLITQLNS